MDVGLGRRNTRAASRIRSRYEGRGPGESGAILIIVALLVFYFLYFASPILIPIVMALLLSMLLAPLVGLMGRLRVPRTLGSLIVVVTAVGSLFGIAASLSGPAQNWLTEPQRFVRLEDLPAF